MQDVRIGIVGCGGRMGRMLIGEIAGTDGMAVAGGVDQAPAIAGQDLGTLAGLAPLGVVAMQDIERLAVQTDVLIDFTVPAATTALVAQAASWGKPLIIGTTGLDASQTGTVAAAARHLPIVWAANFSLGVNLLLGLVEQAAERLGSDYDIEILEMHHRQKIDAPSGTALSLGHAAASGRGASLQTLQVRGRDGITGRREPGTIGFAALRGGDVVGDHTVIFAGTGERLELTHKAADRRIFARGAIRAAQWVIGKRPGLYGMKDVLDLNPAAMSAQ